MNICLKTLLSVAKIAILPLLVLSISCGDTPKESSTGTTVSADTIYDNGEILTMAGETPTYVEALVVADGKIAFAGSKEEALRQKGEETQVIDLGGKTMLPGFIDGHGHFINALTVADQANC